MSAWVNDYLVLVLSIEGALALVLLAWIAVQVTASAAIEARRDAARLIWLRNDVDLLWRAAGRMRNDSASRAARRDLAEAIQRILTHGQGGLPSGEALLLHSRAQDEAVRLGRLLVDQSAGDQDRLSAAESTLGVLRARLGAQIAQARGLPTLGVSTSRGRRSSKRKYSASAANLWPAGRRGETRGR